MTLSYSTEISGKPTCFPEKILLGLWESGKITLTEYEIWSSKFLDHYGEYKTFVKPKFHTIREDKLNRWKAGNKIHPVINNRTPKRFQFVAGLKCISTQKIEIKWTKTGLGNYRTVYIDGKLIFSPANYLRLAINDGFENTFDFFEYFNKEFTGKIIHWTDLRY